MSRRWDWRIAVIASFKNDFNWAADNDALSSQALSMTVTSSLLSFCRNLATSGCISSCTEVSHHRKYGDDKCILLVKS